MPHSQGIEGSPLDSPFIDRRIERDELDTCPAIGRSQHDPCRLGAIKPSHPTDPRTFYDSFPHHVETKGDEERPCGGEIAHDDSHVIDTLNFHVAYLLLLMLKRRAKQTQACQAAHLMDGWDRQGEDIKNRSEINSGPSVTFGALHLRVSPAASILPQ